MGVLADLDRPLCIVPGCGRWCQIYAKPGTFDGNTMYLKTCSRHSTQDALHTMSTNSSGTK